MNKQFNHTIVASWEEVEKLGLEGWELVAIRNTIGSESMFAYYMKKEKWVEKWTMDLTNVVGSKGE